MARLWQHDIGDTGMHTYMCTHWRDLLAPSLTCNCRHCLLVVWELISIWKQSWDIGICAPILIAASTLGYELRHLSDYKYQPNLWCGPCLKKVELNILYVFRHSTSFGLQILFPVIFGTWALTASLQSFCRCHRESLDLLFPALHEGATCVCCSVGYALNLNQNQAQF